MKTDRYEFLRLVVICLALLLPLQATAQEQGGDGAHLFILSGQSNMRGPLPESFRDCVQQVFCQENVIVATAAWPSQPIKNWYRAWVPPEGMQDPRPDTNGHLYDRMMQTVERAVRDRPLATVTYIWMQGEADANAGWSSVYAASFMGVLDQIKADLEIEQINFVVGRINDYWTPENNAVEGPQMRAIQQALGEDHANGAWIDTDDVNQGVNPWGGYSFDDGHFPPAGYVVMGQRFARQACLLIDPDIELDEAVFREVFFDSSDDIGAHAAVGMAVRGSLPPVVRPALSDGRFGTTEPGEGNWLAIEPSEQPIELIVDLREPTEIHAVAINLLVRPDGSAGVPQRIVITFSDDGREYRNPNSRHNAVTFNSRPMRRDLAALDEPLTLLALTSQRDLTARYVKFEITTGDQRVMIDEVVVNPLATE